MSKVAQDTVMGVAIVLTCVMILVQERWFLAETSKGQRLVKWCGPIAAIWLLRGVLVTIAVFGGLLASGMVHPIRW